MTDRSVHICNTNQKLKIIDPINLFHPFSVCDKFRFLGCFNFFLLLVFSFSAISAMMGSQWDLVRTVRHMESLPENEEEGGGEVDDEGVGAGQGGPGADLAEGREDQRENSELMFLSEAPTLQLGLSGGWA